MEVVEEELACRDVEGEVDVEVELACPNEEECPDEEEGLVVVGLNQYLGKSIKTLMKFSLDIVLF